MSVALLTTAAAAARAGRPSFMRSLIDMAAGGRCKVELATRGGGRGRSRVCPQLHSLRDNCFSTCSRSKKSREHMSLVKARKHHKESPQRKKIKTKAFWVWSRPRGSPCDLVRRVQLDRVVATAHQTRSALALLIALVSRAGSWGRVVQVRGTAVALGRVFDASHRVSLSLEDKAQHASTTKDHDIATY
jgi:hypothetical protein